ncbi:MAG: DUF4150 domain-containing protein [Desulfococcaceae bacterium]
MANNVFANGREISCKAADGKSIAAFPDVCFTPPQTAATPPGVPIPYPNTAFAKDTTKGSKRVKISGKEVMLKNKSFYKTSTGDEAGNAPKKGILTSKIKGKAYFTSWSMDVKVEGQNVVRHMDLCTHNHASLPGQTPPKPYTDTMTGPPIKSQERLQNMVCECDKTEMKKGESCMELGDRKHECVDQKIKDHNNAGKRPAIGNESGWSSDTPPVMIPFERKKTYQGTRKGTCWPDAVTFDSQGNPQQIFDFKFKCPTSDYLGPPGWGRRRDGTSQEDAYKDLTRRWGQDPNKYPPTILHNENCP